MHGNRKARSSFLKKRSKKLLFMRKFFGSFFKKNTFLSASRRAHCRLAPRRLEAAGKLVQCPGVRGAAG
jgi:UDP-N-acetylenolpyruvoylglucosamine reductase